LQAETEDNIATALSVVEDEINDILGPACAIAEPDHGRARAESPMKSQLALGDRVKLNERGMRLGARRKLDQD
jgi:predicted transcriptional regulator